MSIEMVRLTLYAVLNAIERDLTEAISTHVLTSKAETQVFHPELLAKLNSRQAKDLYQNDIEDELLNYADFGDKTAILLRELSLLPNTMQKPTKKIVTDLDKIIPVRNRVMHSRPLMYDDHPSVMLVANKIGAGTEPLWKYTVEILRKLKHDNSFLLSLKVIPPSTAEEKTLHNLPSADFDETGFIGRVAPLETLRKALFGAYPVITVTGEGGLGKTALATKACYDLIDDENNPFEAIIWTTAKATKLTATEIIGINDSINTSIGILQKAGSLIDDTQSEDPMGKILSHLSAFPTLLVIDNLETVLDENVRQLVKNIPVGSKILFTSRTSIGAFDFPVPLEPLSMQEATTLLRFTAKFWSVPFLAEAKNDTLRGFCKKLESNPLFIKWFVQAISSGRSPESVLNNRKLILKFCLSSVLENISQQALEILETLVLLGSPQNEPALIFYSDAPDIDVQRSLNELLASNLVRIVKSEKEEHNHAFHPSEMAKNYLKNYGGFKLADENTILQKQNQMKSERERMRGNDKIDPYNFDHFAAVTDIELMATRYLQEAGRLSKAGKHQEARAKCEEALKIDSSYFEAFRALAVINQNDGQMLRAKDNFEAAISLQPDHPPLLFWFGDFLLKSLNEVERAMEQYQLARRLDSDALPIILAIIRAHLIRRDFDTARDEINIAEPLAKKSSQSRIQRRLVDTHCQYFQRKFEYLVDAENFSEALLLLEEFQNQYESFDAVLVDAIARRKIWKMTLSFAPLNGFYQEKSSQQEFLLSFHQWFDREFGNTQVTSEEADIVYLDVDENHNGIIHTMKRGFGFISTDKDRLFFSFADWEDDLLADESLEGLQVEFSLGKNSKGICCKNVRLINLPPEDRAKRTHQGTLVTDNKTYGFLKTINGETYFLHYKNFSGSSPNLKPPIGSRVEFEKSKDAREDKQREATRARLAKSNNIS